MTPWATLLSMLRRPATQIIGPIQSHIDATAPLVYQMLTAIGQGAQQPGERADLVERTPTGFIYDFWSTIQVPILGPRSVRTREAVQLIPPDRIDFEHLDGPVSGLRETITVEAVGGRQTRVVYVATYRPPSLLRAIVFRLIGRRVISVAVRSHFADVRVRAHRRAHRSRVFSQVQTGQTNDAA